MYPAWSRRCATPHYPPPPKLAEIDPGTGQLTLFMGSNAHKREGVGSNTDVAEDFRVTHTGGSLDDESVAVTAFGYTQNFQHVKSIFATAGVGTFSTRFDHMAELSGRPADMVLQKAH